MTHFTPVEKMLKVDPAPTLAISTAPLPVVIELTPAFERQREKRRPSWLVDADAMDRVPAEVEDDTTP
jgi:hypothetical protein